MFASWKAGLVPVNTNYRYADDELVYLWDNADAVAVVFHGTFAEHIERIRDRVPQVQDLALGRRRHAARAPTGPRPTRTPPPRTPSRSRRPGAATATTSTCSTPAAPPACPRA